MQLDENVKEYRAHSAQRPNGVVVVRIVHEPTGLMASAIASSTSTDEAVSTAFFYLQDRVAKRKRRNHAA